MLRLSVLSLLLLSLISACATHSVLDALWYPSEIAYSPASQADTNAVCYGLKAHDYPIDQLEVRNQTVALSYPDGTQAQYSMPEKSVSVMLLTDINRDFDNPTNWSDEEMKRLMGIAQSFCQDVQSVAQASLQSPTYLTVIMRTGS